MDLAAGRVYFLGAGFSAGAGVPLTETLLPLAANLFSHEANGLYERVCNYASQVDVNLDGSPNADDFSRLCTHLEFIELREFAGGERWSADGSREKLALKFFLAKAIALNTPCEETIPEQYLTFVQSLTPNDIVITFNWDTLLEKAIMASGLEYCYNYEPEKIHILKLHGSINWVNNEPKAIGNNRPSLNYKPLGYKDGLMKNEVFCSYELFETERWRQVRSLRACFESS